MLIWGVFVRLGLVYLLAFFSLWREAIARGVTRVREVLARAAADDPGARRKFKFRLGERLDRDDLHGFLIAQPLVGRARLALLAVARRARASAARRPRSSPRRRRIA